MEGGEPPAKKRGSERQITQDDPESGDEDNEPTGEFTKASKQELAQRRIVQVKRKPRDAAPAGANPFAGVSLFGAKPAAPPAPAPAASAAATAEKPADKTPSEGEAKEEGKGEDKAATAAGDQPGNGAAKPAMPLFGSFNSSGSQNPFAFAAASGTASGFSSFAAAASKPADGTEAKPSEPSGGDGEAKEQPPATSTFSFASSSPPAGESSIFPPVSSVFGSSTPLFGGSTAPTAIGLSGRDKPSPVLSEEKQVTGEEEEAVGFSADCTLFEFDDAKTWKERGKGEIRINLASSGQARFVMRQNGNYRLLLNANLWPGINVAVMDGAKGVTFAVVNCAQQPGEEAEDSKPTEPKLSTYAVRFKSKEIVPAFREAVDNHKCKSEDGGEPKAAEGGAEENV